MSKIEAMIEKVKALINAPSCCAEAKEAANKWLEACLLYTSPSPRDS